MVFLMFSIGLEFSLPKLRSMRQTVFGLGMVQVVLTIGIVLLTGLVFGGHFLGVSLTGALSPSAARLRCRRRRS